jgi:release factor family 11
MAINVGARRFGQYRNQDREFSSRRWQNEGPMLHIDIPTLAEFKALAQIKGETCVSVYLPISPLVENIRANRTAFKDLAKEALSQLREAGADKHKIAIFEERFEHLAGVEHDVQDEDKIRKLQRAKPDPIESFWHCQANGLAVLATAGMMRTFRLPNSPKPLAEVAGRLHLTPLIRAMTSPHDVFVLALAEESVRLIHAFADFPPERLQIPDLPRNAEEATRRPSIHVRAPRGRLQNLEGEGAVAEVRKEGRTDHKQGARGTEHAAGSRRGGAACFDVPFGQHLSKAGR